VILKRWNETAEGFFSSLASDLNALSAWKAESIETQFKATADRLGVNPGHVMQLFRVLISGQAGGPVLFEMTELLGQAEVVSRLQTGVTSLK
jgi:glutamyl-tRNA synthetase